METENNAGDWFAFGDLIVRAARQAVDSARLEIEGTARREAVMDRVELAVRRAGGWTAEDKQRVSDVVSRWRAEDDAA